MVIDKIKGILKKEDVEAPKVLPELLSEQVRSDENSSSESITKDKSLELKTETVPESQNNETELIQTEPSQVIQPKVEVTNDSANFIDEDIDNLSNEIVESQEKYKPAQVKVEEPKIEIKPEPKPEPQPVQPVQQEPVNTIPVQEHAMKQEVQNVTKITPISEDSAKPDLQININADNFFAKVENIISADSTKLKELMEDDLFENMRLYHKRKDDGEKIFLHISEIENAVKEKVLHLKVLEDEWLIEKRKLEEQEKLFLNKEEELFDGIEELKSLFSRLETSKKLKKDITLEESFLLESGVRIFSVSGLKKAFMNMNDELYYSHVDQTKNDFASWVEDVFGSSEIANKLRESKNKEEAIKALEDF
ncbi:hypothetical protein C0585_02695 [Candidatus Woesearchaeota archaeon]|nr:MAG: hypothetical protein C0585_02695 [Candidatus Woesearchaeota archaeon]